MREEQKIQNATHKLWKIIDDDDDHPIKSKGDNFKYGMFIGKLIALGWVLDEPSSADLSIHFEFEDWERHNKADDEDGRQKLWGVPPGWTRDGWRQHIEEIERRIANPGNATNADEEL
jgi:hypothetical protein